MEEEKIDVIETSSNPVLEQQITELVEVLQAEQELKVEEAMKNEETEANLQNLETVVQTSTESQTVIIEGLSGLSSQMSGLSSQMNALADQMGEINTTMLLLVDVNEQQNDLIVEGSFMVTLAICVVVSIKVFIDQISKW